MTLVGVMVTAMENHPMDIQKMSTEATEDSGDLNYHIWLIYCCNPLLS